MNSLPKSYRRFRQEHPVVWNAYEELGKQAAEDGPLDLKTRELIKLGMAASAASESAVHSHTHRALQAGASPAEIEHAVQLGITTMGFPRAMAALSWAKEAIRDHEEHKSA
ncbi:MAG: carboxymuconolactone decarboxylase family protein [Anaerolineales bacterium]|nr:carboxymuconolactone decarboxylase family protein [Anaerolineales bacterium]MDD5467261.1 carboxymuconolactone decarboxylase family protein [Anaerolineales bacterium]